MRYDEIRGILRQHFAGLFRKVKDGIAKRNRLRSRKRYAEVYFGDGYSVTRKQREMEGISWK